MCYHLIRHLWIVWPANQQMLVKHVFSYLASALNAL